MSHSQSTPAETTAPGTPPSVADTRLHGAWLLIARVAWLTLVVLSVGLFVASILVYYLALHGVPVSGRLLSAAPTISGYAILILRYTPLVDEYSAFNIALLNGLAFVWIAVGLVIFWRRSDDRIALFASLALVLMGTSFSPSPICWRLCLAPRHREGF